MQSLENRRFFSNIPVLGDWSGTLTPLESTSTFPLKIDITTKSHKYVFSAVITIPGLGEEDFSGNITPASNGSFTFDLGPTTADGTAKGSIASNGKLVVGFLVPGNAPAHADLKRVSS